MCPFSVQSGIFNLKKTPLYIGNSINLFGAKGFHFVPVLPEHTPSLSGSSTAAHQVLY